MSECDNCRFNVDGVCTYEDIEPCPEGGCKATLGKKLEIEK